MIIGITVTEDNRVQIILQDDMDDMHIEFDPASARKVAAQILNAADEAEQ